MYVSVRAEALPGLIPRASSSLKSAIILVLHQEICFFAVGHKLTAIGSLAPLFMNQPTSSSCANLHVQYSISAASRNCYAEHASSEPSAYLLPDVFINDILHNPIDTALIQWHKLRGCQMICAPITLHPEM